MHCLWFLLTLIDICGIYVRISTFRRTFIRTHTHRATSVVSTYACDSCICIIVWDDCWNTYVRSSRPLDTKNHFLTCQHNLVSKIRIFAIIVADTALTYETHSAQYLPSHGTQLIQHSRMRPTVHSNSLTRYTTNTTLTYETHSAQYLPSHGTQLIHEYCSC